VQLATGVLIQPASYREMRATLYSIRSDLASSLVRDGSFTTPAPGLTLYARTTDARGEMRDLFIDDARNPKHALTYTARRGAASLLEGRPVMVLRQGQMMQPQPDGSVNLLDFDQYVLELGEFLREPDSIVLKPSDRFLSELFFPNLANFYDQRNLDRFVSEGHARLASPLLNIALAMIALAALITGDFNRRGYGGRMAIAAAIALTVRLIALAVQSAARGAYALNAVQYAFPIVVIVIAIAVMTWGWRAPKRRVRRPPVHEQRDRARVAVPA
jgi:lipopolysaccharide export system permease protein